jgi:hypothetical protein
MGCDCGKSGFSVRCFDDLKLGIRQQIPQDLPIILLILDHQDALAHDFPACASTRTGSVK